MSKKRAIDFDLTYVHINKPHYLNVGFLDKKGRVMMSSVDIVINTEYFDEEMLRGFVRAR
tara:strand:+ start:1054 stop:1233 length:180 start_codon:yes stop_codon:yes gene_type:complete